MERHELDARFMASEPIDGLSFLLNDSVTVTQGPHQGAVGYVIAVTTITPSPVYRVELASGEVEIKQSHLLSASSIDDGAAIAELQRWYSSQCNGDWEHQYGISIDTLDNPGWALRVDLAGTPLQGKSFHALNELDSPREWYSCKVEGDCFKAAAGPHMLGKIVRRFLSWAQSEETA